MKAAQIAAIAIWLGVLSTAVLVISRTTFTTDMLAFLPRSPSAAQAVLVDQLKEGVVSRLILLAVEDAPPEVLTSLSKALAHRLHADPQFVLVNDGEDAGLSADRAFLWNNRYLLSPAITPEHFSVTALHQALVRDLDLLGSSTSALIKHSLPNDPTGEILQLISQLTGEERPATRDGVWFSSADSRAILMVETSAAGFDLDAQQKAQEFIRADFEAARQAMGQSASTAHLLMAGPGVFAVETRLQMQEDVTRFSLLASILVAGLLIIAYRSLRLLLLGLLPVISGALAGIAAVGLGFGYVHGITLGFGVTLIGEAVDYAVYLFTQTAPGTTPEQTLPRIWPTLRLGVLTSICGFGAMLLSSFNGFAQLGLFTITGLVVAVSVTRWILPVFMPKGFSARATMFAPPLLSLMRRRTALRWPLLGAVLLAALLLYGHHGGLWENELSSLSPTPPADQQLDQQLRRDIGAPDVRYLVVAAASSEEQALVTSERLADVLADLVKQGALAGFDTASRYLPSQATQQARQAALPTADILQSNLAQALTGLPFHPDSFTPFMADIAAAKQQPLLTRASLQNTSLSLKLDSLLIKRPHDWAAMLSLRGVTNPELISKTLAEANVPDSVLLDLKGESDRLLEDYWREAITLSLIGSLVITGLLVISLRSARLVWAVLAPLAAAVILTTALLTLGDGKLSIFNLFGLLLVVAVGSNYCLFFVHQTMNGGHRERTVASLVLANLCTVIAFGVLSFSRIPVLHGIGETVAIGAFLSLILGAILAIDLRHEAA